MMNNILVGYDGSQAAMRAFAAATEMAKAFHGRVHLVSVIGSAAEHLELGAPLAVENEFDWVTNDLRVLADSAREICPVETEVLYGEPAEVLLARAQFHASDHIVVGRSGKGAIARLVVGSVSRELVTRANVALTLVP